MDELIYVLLAVLYPMAIRRLMRITSVSCPMNSPLKISNLDTFFSWVLFCWIICEVLFFAITKLFDQGRKPATVAPEKGKVEFQCLGLYYMGLLLVDQLVHSPYLDVSAVCPICLSLSLYIYICFSVAPTGIAVSSDRLAAIYVVSRCCLRSWIENRTMPHVYLVV